MDILDLVRSELDPGSIEQISNAIGTDVETTEKAVGVALPLLLGGLARNAGTSAHGASSLATAIDQDHSADLLSSLGGGGLGSILGSVLGGAAPSRQLEGGKILEHIFGRRRTGVESGIGKASGLDARKVTMLLSLLAPLVMSALAKRKQQQRLDPDGMARDLNRERREIESKADGVPSGGLTDLLDRDDDGRIADDIASIGASLARSWLAGR